MKNASTTVQQYLASVPEERRAAFAAVRQTVLDNLDGGYEEGIQYGMLGYYVPLSKYPNGYHCDPKQPLPFAALASQKSHLAVYLMGLYLDAELSEWFRTAWAKTGKKLDMGKSCLRFKKLEDVDLSVIGEAFRKLPAKRYIATYEANLGPRGKPAAAEKSPAKKSGPKSTAAKKSPAKTAAKKSAPARRAKSSAR